MKFLHSLSSLLSRTALPIGLLMALSIFPAFAQPKVSTVVIPSFKDYPVAAVMATLLFMIVVIMMIYGVRHVMFTINRLTGKQRHPYIDVVLAKWPMITVFIAAHNEEKVIAGCIEALLRTDYPLDKLKIIPVNDRSKDGTAAIIDRYAERYPSRISPFHLFTAPAARLENQQH